MNRLKSKKSGRLLVTVLGLIILIVAGYLLHHRQTGNIVKDQDFGSADLVGFLKSDDTGCDKQPSYGTGWYRILKELDNNQAELEYGCSANYDQGIGSPAHMLVRKVNGGWQIISPTNQWLSQLPSCSMLQANNISRQLESQCWSGSLTNPSLNAYKGSADVNSYAACLATGGTLQQSYPETCVIGGKSFINPLQQAPSAP